MASQVLDYRNHPAQQPAHALWRSYDPDAAPYAFRARDRETAEHWQSAARAALTDLLQVTERAAAVPEATLIESVDRGDHIRQKLLLQIAPDVATPLYLLLPKNAAAPPPVVLALHGHGYGVKDIVGLTATGEERGDADPGYHRDFGLALCRQGFAVAAPEIGCFGERQNDYSHLQPDSPAATSCQQTAALAAHLGWSVLGMRMLDGLRVVDYLETRNDLDAKHLGAMGISGGGMHAFFSACIDTRISATVISGYFCTFRDSILAIHHCPCNFVPGLAAFGEMHDMIGLVAPRPVLVEAGMKDGIFPFRGVQTAVARARDVYRVFGIDGMPELDAFDDGHRINGDAAYAFLRRHLA